jgi:hypothetical protein
VDRCLKAFATAGVVLHQAHLMPHVWAIVVPIYGLQEEGQKMAGLELAQQLLHAADRGCLIQARRLCLLHVVKVRAKSCTCLQVRNP